MTQATAQRIVWLVVALVVVLSAVNIALVSITVASTDPNIYAFRGAQGCLGLIATAFGAFMVRRLHRNRLGWLMLWTGVSSAVVGMSEEWAIYGLLYSDRNVLGAAVAAWLSEWLWVPCVAAILPLAFLRFPDGLLLSPHWRWAEWASAVSIGLMTFFWAFVLQMSDAFPPHPNVFAIDALGAAEDALMVLAHVAFGLSMLSGVAALLVRFRRSSGEQRQQMKWVLFAVTVAVVFLVLSFATQGRVNALEVIGVLGVFSIPVAIGIAMLRYGLYEIDVVINRTLVYVPLSALLAGLYVVGHGLLRALFADALNLSSDASVAMMAIIVVALVTPVKNKLQTVVDKHFKETVDPAKAINRFSDDLDRVLQVFERERVAKRFLDEIVKAVRAKEASLTLTTSTGDPYVYALNDVVPATRALAVPLDDGESAVGEVVLGPRANGRPYTAAERESIERAAGLLARALHVTVTSPTSSLTPAPSPAA